MSKSDVKFSRPPELTFFPAWLDDFGLSPHEMRVYCHLVRRAGLNGECHPGVRSVATVCKMNKDTAAKCLRALVDKKLVSRRQRSDQKGYDYVLMGDPNQGTKSKKNETGCPTTSDRGVPPRRTGAVPEEGTKGNPVEGNPMKEGSPTPPDKHPSEEEVLSYAKTCSAVLIRDEVARAYFEDRETTGWMKTKGQIQVGIQNWRTDLHGFARAWGNIENEREARRPGSRKVTKGVEAPLTTISADEAERRLREQSEAKEQYLNEKQKRKRDAEEFRRRAIANTKKK